MLRQKIGQYRVIEALGTGGMGRVYRAADETLGRDVALKVLDLNMDESAARLRAEATALARISHPGIATVYELIEDDGRLIMVMELVRGKTLQQLLEQVGAFSPQRAAELCSEALAVLEHAHAAGVVHRDLKPSNLMLTVNGSIKVMDFGIARLNNSTNLTNAGMMLGTPGYMAPEQVLGHPVDARTDLYAMGIVFFRLVTADLPFKADTPFDMAQAQVNESPRKATDMRPDLPSWVDDILARALPKKPADRFQTAAEFRNALQRVIAQAVVPQVAAAVETTEVMARPEIAARQELAEAGAARGADQAARPIVINGWLVVAAAIVLAVGLWLFNPFRASSKTGATDAQAANAEPQPVADPAVDPNATPAPTPDATKTATAADAAKSTVPGVPAKPTPTLAPTSAAVSEEPGRAAASFKDVKFLAVNGSRTAATDVVVEFSDAEVNVQSRDGKTTTSVLPYRGITKATYVRGRDPQWDPSLSGPAGKIDVPGILGRPRHWLVLQGPDRYLILRLDGEDRLDVLKAFEERAGLTIDRSGGKN